MYSFYLNFDFSVAIQILANSQSNRNTQLEWLRTMSERGCTEEKTRVFGLQQNTVCRAQKQKKSKNHLPRQQILPNYSLFVSFPFLRFRRLYLRVVLVVVVGIDDCRKAFTLHC